MTGDAELKRLSRQQASHYDQIAEAYEGHYADRWSLAYRFRFISGPLTAGIPLAGMKTLDAGCGTGELTDHLLELGAHVIGLDISPAVIERFRAKHPAATGIVGSFFDTGFPDATFDCVAVSLALHHAEPNADRAVDELARILKPGGWLVFTEPHRGSLPDLVRKVWYHLDPLFEANEQAVDVEGLEGANAGRFEFASKRYGGNIAYLLVYNSMVFRVPPALKSLYSPALLALESLLARLQGRRTACMVTVQWRKRQHPAPRSSR